MHKVSVSSKQKITSTIAKKKDYKKTAEDYAQELNFLNNEYQKHVARFKEINQKFKDGLANPDFNALAAEATPILNKYKATIEESKGKVPKKLYDYHYWYYFDILYPGEHGGGVKTKRRHRRVRRSRSRTHHSRVRRNRTHRSH